jgi:hypothetical protein
LEHQVLEVQKKGHYWIYFVGSHQVCETKVNY